MKAENKELFRNIRNSWKITLIICSIITIIVIKFTTPFSTFLLVLALILVVVPLILLFTSGIFQDFVFYIKRFQKLPDDNRPTSPGVDGRCSQLSTLHEEMIAGREFKITPIREDKKSIEISSESLIRLSPNYRTMSVMDFFVKDLRNNKSDVDTENQENIKSTITEEMLVLEETIDKLEGRNLNIFLYESGVGYSFVFPDESKYSFIQGMIIKLDQSRNISIEAVLKKYQPYSLAIQVFEKLHRKEDLSKKMTTDHSHPKIFKKILSEDKITTSLNLICKYSSSFYIDKKYFTANEIKNENIIDIISVLRTIYHRLISEDAGIIDVEKIRCYKCNHQLSEENQKCPNCGEIRPRCIVCLLDLYPSETEEVVKTSCCGIYSHKYHLLMWLEEKNRCPNCRTKNPSWVKFLK